MKRLFLSAAFAAACFSAPAMAQQSNSDSQSRATAIVYGGGGDNGGVTRTKGSVKTTGAAIAPGLTAAGVHSCAGSTSGAFGGQGISLGFGTTYEMVECNRRAYAATLQGMGQNAAALALICNNAEVQNALNLTGVACPQQRGAIAIAAAPAPARSAALQPAPQAYRGAQGSVASSGGAIIRSATPWRD